MLHGNKWYKLLMYISIFFILMLISNLSYVMLIGNLYSLLIGATGWCPSDIILSVRYKLLMDVHY